MSEWTDQLARTLGVAPIDAALEGPLLEASREIAHRVERKDTPLSTYLLGVAAGARIADGADPADALRDAVDTLLGALPPAPAGEA
jgi:Domain of unknown function (DUF6457)